MPPAATSASEVTYEQCFCSDARLAAFSTTTGGICDAACTATPADYGSITSWYQSMCSSVQALAVDGTTSSSSSSSTGGSGSSSSKSSGGGGSWCVVVYVTMCNVSAVTNMIFLLRLSSHWQWVIFIVIMVVGIAGIWIGAAIWRRHYLRKKDRQYSLGKNIARRTGSGQNPYNGPNPTRSASILHSHGSVPGGFMPASSSSMGPLTEKPPRTKKKWNFTS